MGLGAKDKQLLKIKWEGSIYPLASYAELFYY